VATADGELLALKALYREAEIWRQKGGLLHSGACLAPTDHGQVAGRSPRNLPRAMCTGLDKRRAVPARGAPPFEPAKVAHQARRRSVVGNNGGGWLINDRGHIQCVSR